MLVAVLAEFVVCPLCHAPLDGVRCTGCSRVFAVDDGAPNLTPIPPPDERVRARWALWEELQANGMEAYATDPPSSLSVGQRPDAEAFAAFCELRGLVLDVGCGIQAMPTYGRGLGDGFVGIDPLRGERERAFAFVQAIAEFLPFGTGPSIACCSQPRSTMSWFPSSRWPRQGGSRSRAAGCASGLAKSRHHGWPSASGGECGGRGGSASARPAPR